MSEPKKLLDLDGMDLESCQIFGHLMKAHLELIAGWELMFKQIQVKKAEQGEGESCPSPDASGAASASAGIDPPAGA